MTDFLSFSILFLTFSLSFYLILKKCNDISSTPLIYSIIWLFLYCFIVPLYGVSINRNFVFGNDISEFVAEAVLYYALGVFSFTLGFAIFHKKIPIIEYTYNSNSLVRSARLTLIISLVSIFFWADLSGYGISSLFFMGNVAVNNLDDFNYGGYNYLKAMFDWSFPALLLATISGMKKKELIFWIVLLSVIFISMGVRYRWLYLLSNFIFLLFLLRGRFLIFKKELLILLFVSCFLLLSVQFRADIKRFSLGLQDSLISESYDDSTIYRIYESLDNYVTFSSVIKYKSSYDYDLGRSLFLEPFIRMTPRSFFDNEKPEVYTLKIMRESFGSYDALMAGKAATNIAEYYIIGGVLGVVILCFIFGCAISYISRRLLVSPSVYSKISFILISTSMYHFISRGYFVGYIMHLSYALTGVAFILLLQSIEKYLGKR